MTRSMPQYDQQPASAPGEWHELRSELVALLDQVESQVARSSRSEPAYAGISERMRDLRHQVTEAEPETRHREALRTVQRTLSRFSDRDEQMTHPRDTLESAIQQIRSRHLGAPQRQSVPHEPAPRFDELADAVTGISGRLERLEGELRQQGHGQTANIKEIAEQLGQLSHVVELLAGAVGETGQVKRLEAQIAGLAKLVAREPQIDLGAVNRRLDDVSATVAKLAELQKAYADRSDAAGLTQRLDDVTATVGRLADMQAQLAGKADTSGLNHRLDEVTATVGRLADLQMQLAGKTDTNGLTRRLDDVTATVGKLAELQVQFVDRVDGIGLTQRLDHVASTVGRLADLQVQVAKRVEEPRDELKAGMKAIEDGVRNIYDRIDTIERSMAVPPAELDKITSELSRLAGAMRTPAQPQGLVELIDALNDRIADVETGGNEVGALKAEVEALRLTVLDSVSPRFDRLETQIEALGERMAERPSDPSIHQLEAQVRQLVARMDQTGEQLTGLAKLYAQPAERLPPPDFNVLADMVAERTSAALGQIVPQAAPALAPQFDAEANHAALAQLDQRIERVLEAVLTQPGDENAALSATINEVNERLARLEASLKPAATPPAPAPVFAPAAAMPAPETVPVTAPLPNLAPAEVDEMAALREVAADLADAERALQFDTYDEDEHEADGQEARDTAPVPSMASGSGGDDPLGPLFIALTEEMSRPVAATPQPQQPHSVRPQADSMPANPAEDAPLVDRPFAEPNPLRAALEVKNGPRRPHPGLDLPHDAMAAPGRPQPRFDPNLAERPPQPRSSLDGGVSAAFEPGAPAVEVQAAPMPSRNTFIEAHRRAARQASSNAVPASEPGSGSLIARALARFQTRTEAPDAGVDAADTAAAATPPEAEAAPPKKSWRPQLRRKLAGDKDIPPAWGPVPESAAEPVAAPDSTATEPTALDEPRPESFLMRHRRPILLAAAAVALVLLTVNLLSQRLQANTDAAPAPSPAAAAPAVDGDIGGPELNPVPMAEQAQPVDVEVPRLIPLVDNLTTASADPAAARGFSAGAASQPMPQSFAATPAAPATPDTLSAGIRPLEVTLESPVQVEMPPEGVGPDALRRAAAAGDVRAQFEVAAIYTEGRAVPEDLKAAAVWYERAASQGFVPAQYRLGSLYENGRGVEQDLPQARLWYQRAAEAGNRMAMHNLAALYAGGGLGAQQFDAAAKWFEEAASRGMRDSQFNLGMLYARGLGVPQDMAQSYKWFSLAAARGDTDAARARDDVASSLDAATVRRLNEDIAAYRPASIDLAANFAPIGTWSRAFDPGETITNAEVVAGVQRALNILGFNVGTPDGIAGPRTAEAIRSFERATGMSETGAINPRLLAVLGSQPV